MSRVFDKLDLIVNRLPGVSANTVQPISDPSGNNMHNDIGESESHRTPSVSSGSVAESDTETHQSHASSQIRFPEKKRQKQHGCRHTHPSNDDVTMQQEQQDSDSENFISDQPGSQYTAPSPADGGAS
jgi:hypothetical protein